MLTREENDLLCRVEGDAPMGQMMRRYWTPVCLIEEVAEADGTPVKAKVLGEDLVVFRDSDGKVGVMAERDFGAAFFDGHIVQNASAQPRTNRTVSFAFGNQTFDDRIRIAFDNAIWHSQAFQIFRQHVRGKVRLFLVQIDRQQFEFNRSAALQFQQQVQQRITVFASAQTNHDFVAVDDHSEIADRFAHTAQQNFLQVFASLHLF